MFIKMPYIPSALTNTPVNHELPFRTIFSLEEKYRKSGFVGDFHRLQAALFFRKPITYARKKLAM